MPTIAYSNLAAPAGQDDNMGGTTQRVYFAPLADFLAIQKPIAVPVTYADRSLIATAHTFPVGKGFITAYCTADKGKIDGKGQGDRDGKSFKQEGEFFYPGSRAEAHGFAATVKNDAFIFLVEMPDSAINGLIQVGTAMFPANIEPEFTSATNSGGVRGYVFKYSAMTPIIHVYTAAITLK